MNHTHDHFIEQTPEGASAHDEQILIKLRERYTA